MVVVLCSLEISFIVCKKRSCRAIGCAEIIDAACTCYWRFLLMMTLVRQLT